MNNKILSTLLTTLLMALTLGLASCSDEQDYPTLPKGKYYVSLGITVNGVTTYYVVNTKDLMGDKITARGQGFEQTGYRDFVQNGNVLYSVGGLGTIDCNGLVMSPDGSMTEKGNFIFANKLDGFTRVDDNTMMGLELPKDHIKGGHLTFYTIDNNTISIASKVTTTPVSPMDDKVIDNSEASLNWWPTITGMCYSGGKVYVSYYPMHPLNCFTPDEDNARVVVYSYPDFKFEKQLLDDRAGATGAFNRFDGLTTDERGDIYVQSSTSIANGFSVSGSKPAGFLRIKSGATAFDPTYQFDFQAASGGFRPAHVLYVGGGKALVEYSTIEDSKIDVKNDRWSDRDLKVSVVNLYTKEFHDIADIPVHTGAGARHIPAVVEGKYVYLAVSTADGIHIYRIDTDNYTAEKGAEVEATFVGGIAVAK